MSGRPVGRNIVCQPVFLSDCLPRTGNKSTRNQLPRKYTDVKCFPEQENPANDVKIFKKMAQILDDHDNLYVGLMCCQRLRRSANKRTAAYHVSTQRRHLSLQVICYTVVSLSVFLE